MENPYIPIGIASSPTEFGILKFTVKKVGKVTGELHDLEEGEILGMIKFTFPVLYELKFSPHQIYTSLEMRMKCGIGKCGRCNIGTKFVCIDGPVFSCEDLLQLPQEY